MSIDIERGGAEALLVIVVAVIVVFLLLRFGAPIMALVASYFGG